MKSIQVDMFAVGLGAAVMTQFGLDDGGVVTVLADGGVGPGHTAKKVSTRLEDAFDSFRSGAPRRIDLIVGTHYDGDHLKGLLPIVQDESIEIGDVWLPPLKNDTDEILSPPEADDFLAGQFYDDPIDTVARYMSDKAAQVHELAELERDALSLARESRERGTGVEGTDAFPYYQDVGEAPLDAMARLRETLRSARTIGERLSAYVTFFEVHEKDAAARTGGRAHETATYDSRYLDAVDLAARFRNRSFPSNNVAIKSSVLQRYPQRARIAPASFARIRKSVAAGAITSSHLAKLVDALRDRKIRPRCRFVSKGRPTRFSWEPSQRRFIGRDQGGPTDLTLTLLGPSEELVQKHHEKLPVGAYLLSVIHQDDPIHLESITASNQLSYILTLETKGQRVLISGDAGCYGFKDDSGDYFRALLQPLTPLHVVQIAHHAGHNYDFYNALIEAGLSQQEDRALLLVSHAIRDEDRPSSVFREFIARLRRQRDVFSLLFTGSPVASKVEDYCDLIHEVVPSGKGAAEGDIRLSYEASGNAGWVVECHAVSVDPPQQTTTAT